MTSSTPSAALAGKSVTGGRLNADAAVAAINGPLPTPTPIATPTPIPSPRRPRPPRRVRRPRRRRRRR